jgi:rod shape-determining protein MreD
MAINTQAPSEILSPPSPWFVALSLLLAFLVRLMPLEQGWVVPDTLALVLLFWNIYQPHRIGLGVAWCFGAAIDVHSSAVFGEHALAYTLLSYCGIMLHRRVLFFSPWMQAVHLLPLLLAAQVVALCIRLVFGAAFPGWWIFLESAVTALLWPVVQALLLAPQKRAAYADDDRGL